MTSEKICIVIPAYNEAQRIGRVLAGVTALGMDVLVVDDGSTDGTAEIARGHDVHLIVHERNRGKGVAIRTAIAWLLERGYAAALFLDADGQHLPEEAPRFLEAYGLSGADLVLGSRMRETSAMPFVRKCSNRFSSLLLSRLAGVRVTDGQSGYRLMSARLLRFLQDRGGARFDFESEMIIDAVRMGMKYEEVPISCIYGDKKSHYHPLRDSGEFFSLVLRKSWELLGRWVRRGPD
jgi:glycosyltransferase involved in cell wall biosynthesis